jgi:signal peptide peptidase SppA
VNNLPHLFSKVFSTPLAIHPAKFDAIIGGVGSRLGIEATHDQIEAAAQSQTAKEKTYAVQEGIAIIPVSGSLMKKTYGLMAQSGCSSYETIGAQIEDAYTNPQVQGILLDIDSPGGEVSGLFELCEMLGELKDKPVYAITDDAAYSAAYAIASCADKLYLTMTAGVGSIGVICAHVDQSDADKKAGLKYSFIFAGDKKADGNSHQPLSESAKDDIEAEVFRNYKMFTSLVSKNRKVSQQAIVDTQAGTFFGENAIEAKLADKVGTFETAFNDLKGAIEGYSSIQKVTTLATASPGQTTALNNYSVQDRKEIYRQLANHLKVAPDLKSEDEETDEIMAKKNIDLSIDELIALHAAKKAEEDEYADKECSDDEEMKKKADAEDGDDEDSEDDKKKKEDGEDEDDAKKGKKANADAIRIVTLCKLAGMSDLASDFILSGATPKDVETALLKHRSAKSKAVRIPNSTVKPASEFAATAKTIEQDKKLDKNKKADAYREYLMAHPEQYLQTMLNRNSGKRSGEDYKFLQNRGY